MKKNIENLLKLIKENTTIYEYEVKRIVLENLINSDDFLELKSYIEDIVNYGCISGVVSETIYTMDNENFIKENLVEILDILEETKKEYGYIPFLNVDNIAWLIYEEVAKEILNCIEELENTPFNSWDI